MKAFAVLAWPFSIKTFSIVLRISSVVGICFGLRFCFKNSTTSSVSFSVNCLSLPPTDSTAFQILSVILFLSNLIILPSSFLTLVIFFTAITTPSH